MPYQDSHAQGDIALQTLLTRPIPAHKSQNTSLLQVEVNETGGNVMGLDGALDEDRNSSESDEKRPNTKPKKALRFQGPANSSNTQGFVYATPLRELKNNSEFVDCTFCGVREATRIKSINNAMTHFAAGFCCAFLGGGCIPYMSPWFKDTEHRCGSCSEVVAIYHRTYRGTGKTAVMAARHHEEEEELEEELPSGEHEVQSFL